MSKFKIFPTVNANVEIEVELLCEKCGSALAGRGDTLGEFEWFPQDFPEQLIEFFLLIRIHDDTHLD